MIKNNTNDHTKDNIYIHEILLVPNKEIIYHINPTILKINFSKNTFAPYQHQNKNNDVPYFLS